MILLGAILGYLVNQSMAEDAAMAAALTLDDYIANFESYRAGLQDSTMPMWGMIGICIFMVVGALTLYETVTVLTSWLVAWVLPRLPSEAPSVDPSIGESPGGP